MKNKKAVFITQGAVIAAIYVVLVIVLTIGALVRYSSGLQKH